MLAIFAIKTPTFSINLAFLKVSLYICFCLSVTCFLKAQPDSIRNRNWQIKPVINTGFILVHRISIGHLVQGYPVIYELNVSKPTFGNKLWHLENNNPDIGMSLQYIDFRNPGQLGYAIVIAPYIELPLNKKERCSRPVLRLCWGPSYLTKKFDISTNHKNIAIGSNFNAFVQFKFFWHLQLNRSLRFEPGFAFTHVSNGRYKNPNLGLNVVSLNAGLNYLIPSSAKPLLVKVDSSTQVKSKHEVLALAAIGFNQRQINTKGLKTLLVSVAYQRNVRNTHKFSAGLDLFYDQNYIIDYENKFQKRPESFDKVRVSARVGYSYNVGRISFPIEMGYYIFQKAQPDGVVVSRLGVRYYARNGFICHFGLRTHFAVAYNFEYGLGYRLYLK